MQIDKINEFIYSILNWMNVPDSWHQAILIALNVALIVVVTILLDRIAKLVILAILSKLVSRSKVVWDDVFLEHKVFHNVAHLVPVIAIDYLVHLLFGGYDILINFVDKLSDLALIWVIFLVLNSVISSLIVLSKGKNQYASIALLSLAQLVKIVLFIFAFFGSISILLDIDLGKIWGAMGALMAVIILVFRDTILGFVASIQISTSKMVKIGDWVVMPEYKADGVLTELNLMTCKIQNWDKTITSVPTYALISSGVKNWEGMTETGARRIMRSINFDVSSIRFLSDEDIEKFKKYTLLKKYIEEKEEDISAYNSMLKENPDVLVNKRRQTNIGLFRKYCELYLESNEHISKSQTLMVRQLQANENGVPLEVYCFADDTRWVNYEGIQSDIFDHFYATANEFGLRIFQNPSGFDISSLNKKS